ncbi:MAG: phosphodiester glycosidase family protein [Thermoguttaceae bacterium]|nr:phosphodiester glycosidase family protein [Thermoguttaceae bacterium]
MKSAFWFPLFFVAALQTVFAQEIPEPKWTPVFHGVDYAHFEVADPLMKVHVLRIDSQAPGISFVTTGRCENYKADEVETDRRTAPDFLMENGLEAAINANFYAPFNFQTRRSRGPSNPKGLVISDGVLVSPPEKGFPSFIQDRRDGLFYVRTVEPGAPIDGIQLAVSGNQILMEGGKRVDSPDSARHPRTAVGVSQDRKIVYFVVVDGRQEGFSIGATYNDLGAIFERLGAYEALNLDGGGSTTMVIRDAADQPKVLNRPVGLGPINTLRHNANSIGIHANRL